MAIVKDKKLKTLDMVYIALSAVLIAICSWISIPTVVPFTLQTFAVFCVVGLLGGKRGAMAIVLYILMGAIGLPVYSNFKGGIGALFGPTGGYIVGFFLAVLIYWLITVLFGHKTFIKAIAMAAGLLAVYTFGTIWFMVVYSRSSGAVGLLTVLGWCVIPFVIPDLIKLAAALYLTSRLAPHIRT